MPAVFDNSSYWTRHQADLRYVKKPITAEDLANALVDPETGEGLLPATVLVPGSVSASEISDEVNALLNMLGPNSRPIPLIGPDDPFPAGLPEGSLVSKAGVLYILRGETWEKAVRTIDLGGKIEGSQFADGIAPVYNVTSLPTIDLDPITHQPTNYKVGDKISLLGGKLYTLTDDGEGGFFWDPDIKASNIDVTAGKITASQLEVDLITAAIVSAGTFKAALVDAGIVTVDQLGAANAEIDALVARKIQSQYIDFTTLSGDSAAVNFITAGMLKAGAVTTDKLIVGNFENMVEDGGFERAQSDGCWIFDAGGFGYGNTGNATTGGHGLSKSPGPSSAVAKNRMVFDVKQGDKFYLEGWAAMWPTNGQIALKLGFFTDKACTTSANGGSSDASLVWTPGDPVTYAFMLKSMVSAAAPADARFARVSVVVSGMTSGAGAWFMDDIYVRRMTGAAFISDLTADYIKTGILDCQNLTVRNLNANALTSGEIDASIVSVKNLDASKITTGELNAQTINVKNLNATNLKSGAVDVQRNTLTVPQFIDCQWSRSINSVVFHGSAGLTANFKMVYKGVTFNIAGNTALPYTNPYVYVTLPAMPAAGTEYAPLLTLSSSKTQPPSTALIVAYIDSYYDAAGAIQLDASTVDEGRIFGGFWKAGFDKGDIQTFRDAWVASYGSYVVPRLGVQLTYTPDAGYPMNSYLSLSNSHVVMETGFRDDFHARGKLELVPWQDDGDSYLPKSLLFRLSYNNQTIVRGGDKGDLGLYIKMPRFNLAAGALGAYAGYVTVREETTGVYYKLPLYN